MKSENQSSQAHISFCEGKEPFFFFPCRTDARLELHGLDPGCVPVCGPMLGSPRAAGEGHSAVLCLLLFFQRGRANAALEDPFKPVSGETEHGALRAASHSPGAWPGLCCFPRTMPPLLDPVGSRIDSFCCGEKGRILQGRSAFQPSPKEISLGEEMKGLSKWKERHGKMTMHKTKSINKAR